jgi:hypothetical protein
MLMSPMGLHWQRSAKTENYKPDLNKSITVLRIIKERRKIGHGSQMGASHQDRLSN